MLKQLYIRNFTLIDTLNMEFRPGFSVITGETGAGKSIILGAIGLLLGQRADTKAIKQGAAKCVIEAHFDLSRYGMDGFFEANDMDFDPSDCIVRRELSATGKSRAFINDTPAPLSLLKELGEQLIDVHSQHQNLLLGKQDFQMEVVDIIAHNADGLAAYAKAFAAYQQTARRLEELKDEIGRNRANADFLQFQHNELVAANLAEGEQEELERMASTMGHSEEIKSALYEASNALNAEGTGAVEALRKAEGALRGIERMLTEAASLAERMETSYIELRDIADEIEARLEHVDFDPAELDRANARLDLLYSLQKKYHADGVAALIAQREAIGEQLSHIENSDEALAELQAQLDAKRQQCEALAAELSKRRKASAGQIEKALLESLVKLGMPRVRFEVRVERGQLRGNGFDNVSFLFSANTSTPLQPVSAVASGGEIARVMLSLKAMISGAVKLPTIIFDEIDTGVSGKVAEQMAHIMRQMGDANRQVISITHLPQIAALGSTHYKVYKEETPEGTTSRMQMLDTEARVREIAQMLSGSDVGEAAISNAKELLGVQKGPSCASR